VHERANNYYHTDDDLLSDRSITLVHEGLLRCLHQAEASSIFLVSRLEVSK